MSPAPRATSPLRMLGLLVGVIVCATLLAYGMTDEVPRGTLAGVLTMSENGRPLARAELTLTSTDTPAKGAEALSYSARTEKDGAFHFRHIRAGQYSLEVSAKEHSANKVIVLVKEGRTERVDVLARPNDPHIKLYASQHVFLPNEEPKIEAHGFALASELKIDLYKLSGEEIARNTGVQNTLEPIRDANRQGGWRPSATPLRSEVHKIVNRDAEGAFIERLDLKALPPGFYYASCSAGPVRDLVFLNISTIALVTKTSSTQTLCYVTDLLTGKPIHGAEIWKAKGKAQGGEKPELVPAGRTDPNGMLWFRSPRPPQHGDDGGDDGGSTQGAVLARNGTSMAVCDFWNYGGRPDGRLFVYTERPLYRPGDLVQFKGIVRKFKGNDYALAGQGSAQISIYDPDENLVQTMTAPVSKHGTFVGSFRTTAEAKPGGYKISCNALGFSDDYYVALAAYRKPQFKIDIAPEKPYYTMGETAKATVTCTYYTGAPAVGAKVHATIFSNQYFDFDNSDEDSGDDSDSSDEGATYQGGDYNFETDGVTDERGRLTIQFPTAQKNTDPDAFVWGLDYAYSINVTVADASGQSFDGSSSVPVFQGDYALNVSSDDYMVSKGQPFKVQAKVSDHKRNPIANQAVSFKVYGVTWSQTDEKEHRVELQTVNATTDASGLAGVSLSVAAAGSVEIVGTCVDRGGRSINSETSLYVEGSGEEAPDQGAGAPALRLTLDKKAYKVGDIAHVLIESETPGGSALLCVQSDDILKTEIVPLDARSTSLTLPIAKAFAPNAYVTLSYVHDKRYSEATRSLRVDRTDRKLTVSVVPGSATYLPGHRASVKVRTVDDHGKPAQADLSLAVVDESIYALEADATNINRGFYPRKSNMVTTSYSFPEIYLDGGDKGGRNIPIRSKFLDTAVWKPDVETDENGEATVDFQLPDNITEWRCTVVAATDDTAVGMQTANFKALKPLMARIDGPTFMVQGDKQRVVVAVTNDTGGDADVHVRLKMEGATAEEKDLERTVHIQAGKIENLEWNVVATSPGTGGLTATAWIDHGDSDGVLKSFPIEPRGRLQTDFASGPVDGSRSVDFTLSETSDTHYGRLAVTIAPSLATAMVQSLDGLIDYPYGCVEQTMDRFVPAITVEKLVKDLNLPRPSRMDQVPEIARESLDRIATMQHGDGGWGWWVYDKSDPFMTAFVLSGLREAEAAGYRNSRIRLDQALKWAADYAAKSPAAEPPNKASSWERPIRLQDRVLLLDALVQYGKRDVAIAALKGLDWKAADPSDLAAGILLYHHLGSSFASKESQMIDRLKSYAVTENGATHWLPQGWSGAEENTGRAFAALMEARPDDPVNDRIVAYLMQERHADMWSSTYATGLALRGIELYMRRIHASVANATITVSLNGVPARTFTISPATLFDASYALEIPVDRLRRGKNVLTLSESGGKAAYFLAELKQYGTEAQEQPFQGDKTLKVNKSYRVLKARRMEDGTLRLMPSDQPVDSVESGDVVQCTLHIVATEPREFVMIEDPLPSNCRVTERDAVDDPSEWDYVWSSLVVRDDRVALFLNRLPAGSTDIVYTLRAEGSGLSRALPGTVVAMYDPAVQSSSAEAPLEVTR